MDNWFVLAAILILCMVGIKPCSNLENGLSIEQSRIIKGLAALILVSVHIGNSLSNDGVFGVLSAGGYLFVSLFFFYSGYGTFIGLKKSSGNVGGGIQYLLRHIWKLIKLLIITEIIYFIIYAIYGEIEISLSNLLLCISGWRMLAGQMWYIPALIIIYFGMLLLIIIAPKTSDKRILLAIFGISLYIGYALARQRQFHELQSCIAFLLGGLIYDSPKVKNSMIPANKARKRLQIIIYAIVFMAANATIYLVRHYYADMYPIRVACGWISVVCFIGIVMCLLSGVSIGNQMLVFVGTLFTWIYLSHQLIINILNWSWSTLFNYEDSTLLSLGILGITIAISYVINLLVLMKCKITKSH